MTYLPVIVMSALGACLGSFTSVLIYRLYKDEGQILWGRSHCCQTGKPLRWWELVPIFSWIFLGGKSAYTGKSIPVFYLVLELVFATTFGIFAHQYLDSFSVENMWKTLPLFMAVFFALVLFFYDAKYMVVDQRISWPGIGFALLWALFRSWDEGLDWEIFRGFLLGGIFGFGFYFLQYILSGKKWVGAGDQELGLFMGLLLGWTDLLLAGFLAYIVGTVYAVGFLLTHKKATGKTPLPMGAFLMPALLMFLYDTEIWWQLYDSVFSF